MNNNLELIDNIDGIIYGSSPLHRLLAKNENIGYDSSNLTIAILSCNRADATIKLLRTLKDVCVSFKGKVLIADNGSESETIEKLEKEIAELKTLNCKLVLFGENLGVSKGRNESIKHVETEWVMFLDNDIYFIKDIFKTIQNNIAQFQCKFLNLGLLNHDQKTIFSYGGHIYLTSQKDFIHVGCGSQYIQENIDNVNMERLKPCLSTFLFGGSSVINKEKFIELGGFDEAMFIGFEDIDFSIKIFNEGLKIGTCNEIGMVHDHVISENVNDIEYEKQRFSNERLYESAKYFEQKHGLKIWNEETEEWLQNRENALGIQSEEKTVKEEKKFKVALIVDTRNWALDNIAKNIVKNLKNKFDFKVIYMDEIEDGNIIHCFYACTDCHIVHFLWRGIINYLYGDFTRDYLQLYNRGYENYRKEVLDYIYITTSVYDHNYLNKEEYYMTEHIMEFVRKYTVSSKKLLDTYSNLKLENPLMEITDGVDLNLFYPKNIERLNNIKEREVVIGWVGNSKWNANSNDHKGVHTIIKPAVEELVAEGYKLRLEFTDKQDGFIPHNEMVNYYSKIDLYICASLNEGTPNPVLESMACGIPVISTDVGIVEEALGEKQKRYILEDRTKECLKEKIKLFINNLDEIKELSNENLERIQEWSWEKKANQFGEFFDKCLQHQKEIRGEV